MDNQQPQGPTYLPGYLPVDHDLLIRVDQKLSQLSLDVAKTNDGLTARLAVLEAKVITYDQILAEYDPKKIAPIVYADHNDIAQLKFTGKLFAFLGGLIGGIIAFIGAVLLILNNIIRLGTVK